MKDDFFLDTNISVYCFDKTDKRKFKIANNLLEKRFTKGKAVISYQVVQEFINVSLTKFEHPLNKKDQNDFLNNILEPLWRVYPDSELFTSSINICSRWKYSFYDSLIIASALSANCNILYSEDLQHGQTIKKLKIVNPFLK